MAAQIQQRTSKRLTRSKSNLIQNSDRSEEVSSTTIILPSDESVQTELSTICSLTSKSPTLIVASSSTKLTPKLPQSAGASSSQKIVSTHSTSAKSVANNKEIKKVLTSVSGSNSAKKHNQSQADSGNNGKSSSTNSGHSSSASSASTAAIKEQNSFTAADSNSGNSPTKSFVPCKVCGDKASGYHYGVTSCEGCKGFFRRSIQKQIEYRCLRDGKCLVIRLNRNRCQYCRFKKCLAVGMSRDSVRYGRVPKRSRERGEENRVTQSEADQSARELENKQLAMYDIILTISQAHHANCAYIDEKTRGLTRKPAIFTLDDFQNSPIEGSPSSNTADSLEQQKIVMWQQFAVLVTPAIQRVVEFAKRIPGFLDLTQDDQLILIKTGFFEMWIVHVARMTSTMENTVTFSDGSYITRQQMELMFDYEFVSGIFSFMAMFNNLQLSDTEVGIFSAVVLLQSERPCICDTKAIDCNQEKLMEALKLQISRSHVGDTHTFPTLMANIGELRTLGSKHTEHLAWFRTNWARLKLPPLFAEIFDIPKSSDEEFMY